MSPHLTRRDLLTTTAGALALGATLSANSTLHAKEGFKTKNNRIKQSVMGWCFNPMPAVELAQHCKDMGLVAIEGISADHYPAVRKLGLKISLISSHGFAKGPFNRDNHEFCISKLRTGIDLAVEHGCENVITFTGMREKGISDEQGILNCLDCWKQVIPYAEEKKINLCLEHLNSRDGSHPMKGHPGYQGDDVDYCAKIIREVGSERMKLLFDIYHVQIMNGDVMRRIDELKDIIGHVHTAGNPGRGELDENQEINYPPIMRKLVEVGYQGYVGQEFIPTRNPLAGLTQAVKLCDV